MSNKWTCLALGAALTAGVAGAQAAQAELPKHVSLDAGVQGEPINPFIYGQFIEHLGKCINEGIWAEMVQDRKFFATVDTGASPWRRIGPPEAVQMTKERPFVNGRVPLVTVTNGEAGLFQGDLAVAKGKRYVGHIWLAGEEKAGPVEVRLVWGDTPEMRTRVLIEQPASDYRKYMLEFTAQADTTHARLEIVGKERSSVRLGPVSLMPADNVRGLRADVLALIKELRSPIYRWPGGTFATIYEWRDGIGDRDRRPTRENLAWGGLEANDFGFHEFIDFCREVNAEPLVTVNTGLGDPYSAGEWVRYANDSEQTAMGAWRARNGSAKPFGVKYWCVGNEMWNVWSWGFMEARYYVKKHNMTVDRMRAADPGIVSVASTRFNATYLRNDTKKEVAWNDLMIEQSVDRMEYMGEHFYVTEKTNIVEHVRLGAAEVRRIGEDFRALRQKYPTLKQSPVLLAMTEWNVGHGPNVDGCGTMADRYCLHDGLLIAAALHEYFRQSDVYFMANMAQTVNALGAIKATKTTAWLESIGLAMVMYRHHFGTVPLNVAGDCAPLDVMGALTADGKTLTVGVVNPTAERAPLQLDLKGMERVGGGRAHWFGGGDDPFVCNDPENTHRVRLQEKEAGTDGPLVVEPYSATIFVLPLKEKPSAAAR